MKRDYGARRLVVRLLPACIAVAAVIGGCALLRALGRRAEDRGRRAYLEERDRQTRVVRQELDDLKALGERERAEKVWQLWLKVADEWWSCASTLKYDVLAPELKSLGDNAFNVLVEEIRNGTCDHAREASEHLGMFGERATYALIEILKTGSDNAQSAALAGLWYRTDVTNEEREAILEAVRPFADGPEESQRTDAQSIIKRLER
ncbi:MAG: hypothetical protein JW889_02080 [Verrucomicrobia bacterium]|nr:hypothetical protein [Verrucomicrobiota bacterium]